MILIVYTVCALSSGPPICETHALRPADPAASEETCEAVVQAVVAQAVRPGWRVVRFGCSREA